MGSHDRWVIARDLAIFQVKLVLDGAKDIVFSQLAILAAAADILFPGEVRGRRFYAVLRAGERADRWLSLYGASEKAGDDNEGLFGASRAGSDTLLGKLEAFVLGHDEPEELTENPPRKESAAA